MSPFMRLLSDRRFLMACLLGAMPFIVVACFTEARGWAVTVFVVLGVLVAFGVNAGDGRQPDRNDTERFLLGLLAKHGYSGSARLDDLKHHVTAGSAADSVTVSFKTTVTITEALYQITLPPAEICGALTPRRVVALGDIATRLAEESPGVPGLTLPVPPQDPYARQFIQARSQSGWSFPISGTARATYAAQDGWHYSLTVAPKELDLLSQTGRPRAAFHDAIALDASDGLQHLREIVQAWQKYEHDLKAARAVIDQHRVHRGHHAVATFFATHRPGTCFDGTGETVMQKIAPLPFWLELTALDPAQDLVHFSLRPHRISPHARHFTATVEHESETGIVRLMARTSASDAAPYGGPLLSAATAFTMEFLWEFNGIARLTGHGADFVLHLREAGLDALTGLRALGLDREREIWNAVAPGTRYAGAFILDGCEKQLQLLFLPGAQPGSLIAQIESEGWSGGCNVTRNSCPPADGDHDLSLEPLNLPAPVSAHAEAVAAPGPQLRLRVQGEELQGFIVGEAGAVPVTLRR